MERNRLLLQHCNENNGRDDKAELVYPTLPDLLLLHLVLVCSKVSKAAINH